jgi:hypothetical protein
VSHHDAELHTLEHGHAFRFRDWPNPEVPNVAAGVYTIWAGDELVYVGMAGRGLTSDHIEAHRRDGRRNIGLRSRLASHASGRRSGDQFCVYVSDRLVLPHLTPGQISEIAANRLSLDKLVREHIHQHLSYRYLETTDSSTAHELERLIREGALQAGRPSLNPL